MYRDRFFEVLESPYTPYVAIELIYAIVVICFNLNLGNLNKQLTHHFDIDKMINQKDVSIASNVMSYENNRSGHFLFYGILLIIIGFIIPILFSIINKSSYKREEIKNAIWFIIAIVIVVNFFLIISISRALLSPIIIATLIVCAVGATLGSLAISNT
ncbi:hypothetical protein AZK17_09410 [Streptococcus pneumoniae]|nr:hypothetical protein AZK17_09410 [Streptococcus pneumoniae]